MFTLQSEYAPSGDQPQAIKDILATFAEHKKSVTLLGATGTGKTFTMANIIQNLGRPTLVISHNKTLAAQLATEFKYFFPNNAVHYFVSYFDYYQPESYLPDKDMYIEKEATINQEIEMYRLSTLASLLTRKDVIVVASVSALYGLGQKEFFEKYSLSLKVGGEYDFDVLKRQLLIMQYKPVQSKVEQGMFEFRGETLDVFLSTEKLMYRFYFDENRLHLIQKKDGVTFKDLGEVERITIWPSSQYLQDMSDLENILKLIEAEMEVTAAEFEKNNQLVEAQRIRKRVGYDIRMIKETGFVNGIENYSLYFDGREPGEPPFTIFDYFPDDMLMIVDESHMSLPQLRAMPQADKARKENLVKHGFRLPSARDHRPLSYEELEVKLGWKKAEKDSVLGLTISPKPDAQTLFVSATPGPYEIQLSDHVVQQLIRPTGLLDPYTFIYPKSGAYQPLVNSVETLLKKKPQLKKYLNGYQDHINFEEVFHGVEEN